MKKLTTSLIIILIIVFSIGILFRFQQKSKISGEFSPAELQQNLGSIILKNTKFKKFSVDKFSLEYPDWTKIEVDPLTVWPKEIVAKEKILLYLINTDGVTVLITEREIDPEDLIKPYPLIFRKVFEEERKILEEKGGLTDYQIIREDFFKNGIIIESKEIIFSKPVTSISKSVISKKADQGFIYSVGISAQDRIFEAYRPLANYIIDSVRCY